MPVAEPTVATDGLPLVHTPPVVVLARVVVPPTVVDSVPVIAAGVGLTVNVVVT